MGRGGPVTATTPHGASASADQWESSTVANGTGATLSAVVRWKVTSAMPSVPFRLGLLVSTTPVSLRASMKCVAVATAFRCQSLLEVADFCQLAASAAEANGHTGVGPVRMEVYAETVDLVTAGVVLGAAGLATTVASVRSLAVV